MIIEKIIKELTPERVKKEIATIQAIELPPELQKWIKEYEKVGNRNDFLWKWAYKVSDIITLPGAPRIYQEKLIKTKFLLILYITLLDDVADKLCDKKLLDKILKVSNGLSDGELSQFSQNKRNYLKFTEKVWLSLKKSIITFPYYQNFKEIIKFDFDQIINGMRYAFLINKNPYYVNKLEAKIYLSYNTPATISYMIDLTCFKNFNSKNIGIAREIAWNAQIMTRIANWLATWEREIEENDVTSGIFIFALEKNLINLRDLKNSNEIKNKLKKTPAEKFFLKQWEIYYNKIMNFKKGNCKIEIDKILSSIKKLTILHLISKNFI